MFGVRKPISSRENSSKFLEPLDRSEFDEVRFAPSVRLAGGIARSLVGLSQQLPNESSSLDAERRRSMSCHPSATVAHQAVA